MSHDFSEQYNNDKNSKVQDEESQLYNNDINNNIHDILYGNVFEKTNTGF